MLGTLGRLVDGRTECKMAGGTAGKPIKDVMGYAETANPARSGRSPRENGGPGPATRAARVLAYREDTRSHQGVEYHHLRTWPPCRKRRPTRLTADRPPPPSHQPAHRPATSPTRSISSEPCYG